MQGTGIPRDPARAVALLTKASEAGSAIATFNLGVLAQSGTTGTPASAIDFFKKATELGDPPAISLQPFSSTRDGVSEGSDGGGQDASAGR